MVHNARPRADLERTVAAASAPSVLLPGGHPGQRRPAVRWRDGCRIDAALRGYAPRMESQMSVPTGMPNRVVAVGASAGGVQALKEMAAELPRDLPCAVSVALHLPAGAASALAGIIDRCGPLAAVTVRAGDALTNGGIHVAVPDRHLPVDDHQVVLSQGPTESGHRPAIKPTGSCDDH